MLASVLIIITTTIVTLIMAVMHMHINIITHQITT